MPDYSDFEYHRVQRLFYRAARQLALTAVVIAPWLFGSAEPWAYILVCMIASLSMAIFLLSKICFPERRIVATASTITLVIMLFLLLFQIMPLPPALAGFLNGPAIEAADVRDAVFADMGEPVEANITRHASSCPVETSMALYLFVAYLSVFIVLANTLRSWRHIEWITSTLVISSFLLVILSLLHKFSGEAPKQIFWFHQPSYPGDVMGPFTNRNHFAFHMLMVFGMTLGLYGSMLRARRGRNEDWRERLAWIDPRQASQVVLTGFALSIFGAAIFVSLSRGAVVSLIGAAGILWMVLSRTREKHSGRNMMLAAGALVFAAVAWMGWDPVMARLGSLIGELQDPMSNTRAVATRDTLLIAKDHPLLGCGFGCFKYVFPMYQGMLLGPGIFLHAHNDWAEMLAEGGLLASAAFITTIVFFFRSVARHYPDAIGRARRYVRGLLLAVIAVMIHSLFDYSLHKPANAFLLCAICGMMMATVHMSAIWNVERDGEKEAEQLKQERWFIWARVIPFLALVFLAVIILQESACLRRAVAFERFTYAGKLVDDLEDPVMLKRAVSSAIEEVELVERNRSVSPLIARSMASSMVRWTLNDRIPLDLREYMARRAKALAINAVYNAPSDYLNWLWLGRAYVILDDWDNAYKCLDRARQLRPYGLEVMLVEEYAE